MEEASVAQALDDLRACYGAFMEKLEKSRISSVGEAMGNLFRTQGNPRVSYAVEEFNDTVNSRVAALAALLESCPAEEARQFALSALEQILFYPPPADHTTAFSLAAFEGCALPLIPFLPPEQRQELGRRYARRTAPRHMLPNQKKVWTALTIR